jgi:hypothetical protein
LRYKIAAWGFCVKNLRFCVRVPRETRFDRRG